MFRILTSIEQVLLSPFFKVCFVIGFITIVGLARGIACVNLMADNCKVFVMFLAKISLFNDFINLVIKDIISKDIWINLICYIESTLTQKCTSYQKLQINNNT